MANCADVCPAKEKALVMEPLDTQEKEVENWAFAVDTKKVAPKGDLMNVKTVKGSQFETTTYSSSLVLVQDVEKLHTC